MSAPGVLPLALAAALAPSAPLSAWAVAKAIFDASRAEEVAHDQALWMPAYEASLAGGPEIPEHIDAELDGLMDARNNAGVPIELLGALRGMRRTRRRANVDR